MTLTIRKAAGADDMAACLELRRIVFIVEQQVSEADERDGREAEAVHILALEGDTPVGTLRIRQVDGYGKIERVCVTAAARGKGYGKALTQAAVDEIAMWPGVKAAKLSAQVQVIGFYERHGFVAQGPEYLDAGISHRDMVRAL